MKKTALISALLLMFPALASAQALGPIKQLVVSIGQIFDLLIPVLIAAALVVFFYGLVSYIWGAGDEKAHTTGRSIMIAGLVSLFIMVSVWGIINLAQNALGVNPGGGVIIPQVPQARGY